MDNKHIENMETVFNNLGDMKLTKSQRARLAGMLRIAFINGFHAALANHAGLHEDTERMEVVTQSDICRHVLFLENQNSK